MSPRILRTPEAARYVGLKTGTLEKFRAQGGGPPFVRIGARVVGYDVRALDAWIDSDERLAGVGRARVQANPTGSTGAGKPRRSVRRPGCGLGSGETSDS